MARFKGIPALLALLLIYSVGDARRPVAESRRDRDDPEANRPAGHAAAQSPLAPRRSLLNDAVETRKNGDLMMAEHILIRLIKEETTSPDAQLGCVLLGQMLNEQGRNGDAARTLSECAPPDTLTDLHAFTLGKALKALGQSLHAAKLFGETAEMLDSPLAPKAGFLRADALFDGEKWRSALRQYKSMIGQYPEYPQRDMVRFRMAKCEEQLGRLRMAAKAYDSLVRRARDGGMAQWLSKASLNSLRERGVRIRLRSWDDNFDWGVHLRKKRRWDEALIVLSPLPDMARSSTDRANAHFQMARTLTSLDRYEEALEHVALSRKAGGVSSRILDARVNLLRRLGRTEEAVQIVSRRAGRSKKVRGLAAAQVYYEDGEYGKAYALYKRYLRTRHNRKNQWLLAWTAYRAGDYKQAIRGFSALSGGRRGIRKHKAEYWHARALQKAGETEDAVNAFRDVATADTLGYYGLQAANRVLEMGKTSEYRELTGSGSSTVPWPEDVQKIGGGIRWNAADGADLPPTPAPKYSTENLRVAAETYGEAFPELWRAYDRYRMGLNEDARKELRAALYMQRRSRKASPRRLADRPATLFFDYKRHKRGLWGSRLDRRMGLNRWEKRKRQARLEAIKDSGSKAGGVIKDLLIEFDDPYYTRRDTLRNHWRALRLPPNDMSREWFKNVYPLAFEDVLRRETDRFGVPPFLMTSIARVESGFNELAVSGAGARGLMQVIPITGNLIATWRGETEFAASQLLDPAFSLSYGTWYMDQLLTKFKNQEPLAIISYNCGPHRVSKWLARRGHNSETDEFIEEVPYRQARRYVKSVLRYISLYRRTWMKRPDLYVGQKLDSAFRDNINW